MLLKNVPLDVFTVSETWLKPTVTDNEISLYGCSCMRFDRKGGNGGGTMAYVRDVIPYGIRSDLGRISSESCVIEMLQPKTKKLVVWTIYRAYTCC